MVKSNNETFVFWCILFLHKNINKEINLRLNCVLIILVLIILSWKGWMYIYNLYERVYFIISSNLCFIIQSIPFWLQMFLIDKPNLSFVSNMILLL